MKKNIIKGKIAVFALIFSAAALLLGAFFAFKAFDKNGLNPAAQNTASLQAASTVPDAGYEFTISQAGATSFSAEGYALDGSGQHTGDKIIIASQTTAQSVIDEIDTGRLTAVKKLIFGNGTAIDIGTASLNLSNGAYIFAGSLTSTNNSSTAGTIVLSNGASFNMGEGAIANTMNSFDARTIYNASSGAVNISGGTVSANTGMAVYNASTGVITISETDKENAPALITSANTSSGAATVYLADSGTDTAARLIITGGTVKNTADNTNARTIYNNSTGAVNISGGAVSAEKANGIYNNSAGDINISGGKLTTGLTCVASYGKGNVNISGGEIITESTGAISFYSSDSGDLNITGGTISAENTALYVYRFNGVINISESDKENNPTVISGGHTGNGGAIMFYSYVTGDGPVLNIYGGLIENTSSTGRTIYNGSSRGINIEGGTIRGGGGGNGGAAIWARSPGTVKISETDKANNPTLITSSVTSSEGVIRFSDTSTGSSLDFLGGTIENTALTGSRYLVSKDTNTVVKIGTKTAAGSITTNALSALACDGFAQTPAVTFSGTGLTKDTDYTLNYLDNINAGVAKCELKVNKEETGSSGVFRVCFEITKGTLDMSGITFEGKTVTYDGNVQNLEIEGALPSGVSVDYENNGKINAGTYTVTAKFAITDTVNYNEIHEMTAQLIIEKADVDMAGILLANKTVAYNGSAQSIAITGTLQAGITVIYTGGGTNVGTYTVTAKFTITNAENYNDTEIPDKTAQLTINKADGSGNVTIAGWKAGSSASEPEISGIASEYGAPVYEYKLKGAEDSTYTIDKPVAAGEYTVRAKFAATANYNEYLTAGFDFTIENADGLSGGAVAAIVIGSVIVLGLGGFAIFWFVIKKKKFADLIAVFKKGK